MYISAYFILTKTSKNSISIKVMVSHILYDYIKIEGHSFLDKTFPIFFPCGSMKCLVIHFTLIILMKDYTERAFIFIGLSLTNQTAVATIPRESKKRGESFSLGKVDINR